MPIVMIICLFCLDVFTFTAGHLELPAISPAPHSSGYTHEIPPPPPVFIVCCNCMQSCVPWTQRLPPQQASAEE
jgi:hypothetical protein